VHFAHCSAWKSDRVALRLPNVRWLSPQRRLLVPTVTTHHTCGFTSTPSRSSRIGQPTIEGCHLSQAGTQTRSTLTGSIFFMDVCAPQVCLSIFERAIEFCEIRAELHRQPQVHNGSRSDSGATGLTLCSELRGRLWPSKSGLRSCVCSAFRARVALSGVNLSIVGYAHAHRECPIREYVRRDQFVLPRRFLSPEPAPLPAKRTTSPRSRVLQRMRVPARAVVPVPVPISRAMVRTGLSLQHSFVPVGTSESFEL
jgi:hypothetical protein